MAEVDYGYGDMDYGYGDPEPEQTDSKGEEAAPVGRPKRRCSVTKFSLPTETPLTAASVINDLRNGLLVPVSPSPSLVPEDQKGDMDDVDTGSGGSGELVPETDRASPGRKKSGMLRFLKRR